MRTSGGKYNRARGHGALGEALDALAEEHGTLTALAKVLGCGVESLSRWVRGGTKPAPKYAEKLCELAPEMRTLLVEHGCFVAPNRRPRAPGQMGPGTSRRTQQRREASSKAAAMRAADPDLPWPSKATKKQRRPMLKLLVAARREREREQRRKERVEASQAALPKIGAPSRVHSVSHSSDFIERLDVLASSDVAFTPSCAMEDR